jgi:hypothetical protein
VATRAGKARTDVDLDGQLELFDGALDRPLPVGGDQQERWNRDVETFAVEIAHPSERTWVRRHADADRAVLRALEDAPLRGDFPRIVSAHEPSDRLSRALPREESRVLSDQWRTLRRSATISVAIRQRAPSNSPAVGIRAWRVVVLVHSPQANQDARSRVYAFS